MIFGREFRLRFCHYYYFYHHHLLRLLQKLLLSELGDEEYLGMVGLGGGQLEISWTLWAGAFADHCTPAARYLRQKVLRPL